MRIHILSMKSICLILMVCFILISASSGQQASIAEVFRTGQVRFVPEITITDNAMAGKNYFAQISDIAIDEQGNLYACDSKEGNIKKFSASGSFLKTIGNAGQGPGEFNYPIEIEFSKGRLCVRELWNMRVSIFDRDRNFMKSVPYEFSGGKWLNMRALPDGRFIVQREKVNREELNAPQDVFIDLFSSELEFIKTIYRHQVRRNKYITEPRNINVPIPFAPLVYWDVTPDGKLVAGYSGEYEIEVHDPDKGKISSFSHSYIPVEVTAKDKELYFQGMTVAVGGPSGIASQQKGAPDYIIKNTEFPRYKPPYTNIKVDAEGNIWVQLFGLTIDKDGPRMDVFDSVGHPFGSVRIKDGGVFPYRMVPLPGGFWTIRLNEDGEWTIVKYKISN